MANGKYDSPEDRKRRTTTRSLSALQEQKAQYRDASASPAETRQRSRELFDSKMGLPRGSKSMSIDDIAGAKSKSERKRDLDRLKEIEKMQKQEEKNRAKKAGRPTARGGGGSQAVKRGMGLTGPNPFAKRMEEGGMAISDADIASVRRAFGSQRDGENTISDADRQRLQQFLADTGNDQSIRRMRQNRRRANQSSNTISNADIARIMQSIGMEDGGEAVPAKFKGFSKLPEKVQQKMDPDLAQKYEKGGAVGSCRGMGAALRGGKFSGVK